MLAELAQATTPRAASSCGWKACARRRKLPDCTRRPFGVFRRGLRTPAVRKHVSGADGIHFWLAPTVKPEVCDFFSFFSCSYKKRTRFSPLQRRRYVLFSAGRKDTKRAVEATASNSHPSAEKRIHTGSQQTEPRTCVHSPSFAVREVIAAGKSAPAGARVPGLHSPPVRRVPPWIARVYECKHVSLPCIFLKIHRTESKE